MRASKTNNFSNLKPMGGVDEDLIFLDKKGTVIEVYPRGSDAQKRYQKMIEICHEIDKRTLQELIEKKRIEKEKVDKTFDKIDKKMINKQEKRKLKRYSLSDVARVLKIPRQTIYYWIKKGWVKPRRDSRHYPVFTVFDIENIMKWRNKLDFDNFTRKLDKNRKY